MAVMNCCTDISRIMALCEIVTKCNLLHSCAVTSIPFFFSPADNTDVVFCVKRLISCKISCALSHRHAMFTSHKEARVLGEEVAVHTAQLQQPELLYLEQSNMLHCFHLIFVVFLLAEAACVFYPLYLASLLSLRKHSGV